MRLRLSEGVRRARDVSTESGSEMVMDQRAPPMTEEEQNHSIAVTWREGGRGGVGG